MIYLDHAASTPARPEARAAMEPWLADAGNPSSLHAAGRRARRAVEDARERVAARLGADPKEIVFTSGATEANHLALLGVAGHVVTTSIEHASVLELCATRVAPDAEGVVSAKDVAAAVTPKTVLVSVMAVNNETGAVQPLEAIRRALPKGVLLHTDAAQAVGRFPVDLAVADLVTFSAHKIQGPKGVGGLRVRKGVALAPLLKGGGQEFERRAGTENVAGIVGFAAALDLACAALAEDVARQAALRDRLEAGLGGTRNGPAAGRAAHLANVAFEGVDGEAAVLALDAEGVCVSSGSACASGGTEPSHVLLAMGQSKARAKAGIRFSLGPSTTEAEIDAAVQAARRVVERLRKR
ncbi:MAG TPA: cysteine desulfurase family protein [Planctomycetota bacterium]